MPSGMDKGYDHHGISPSIGATDKPMAHSYPSEVAAEVPAEVPADVPSVSANRSPDMAYTQAVSNQSHVVNPPLGEQNASSNFTSAADHNWSSYHNPNQP